MKEKKLILICLALTLFISIISAVDVLPGSSIELPKLTLTNDGNNCITFGNITGGWSRCYAYCSWHVTRHNFIGTTLASAFIYPVTFSEWRNYTSGYPYIDGGADLQRMNINDTCPKETRYLLSLSSNMTYSARIDYLYIMWDPDTQLWEEINPSFQPQELTVNYNELPVPEPSQELIQGFLNKLLLKVRGFFCRYLGWFC